ncbi:ABC-type transporter ATP-binding protein EcsA [uncultured Clostridium sp.]|nr:ABC-type transporter ATP-binding protein EcsA [uncultured Clostridium sp.]
MAADILTIRHLTKTYNKEKKAVDDLSLTVQAGDIYGFIGHNGAGKTTTIRAVTGVMDFDQGEIFICGHSVKKDSVQCKSMTAYIPDNPDLYEHLTGIQYLNFIGDIFQVPRQEREERIRHYGNLLELTPNLGDLISSYSHGMKQKTAIISAFLHQPRLLVLDEPFVGLDPKASFDLKNMMHELCGKGSAIFFSTHVLEVAEKLCNKIAIIKNGKLIASGNTQDVRGDSSLEEVFLEVVDHDA